MTLGQLIKERAYVPYSGMEDGALVVSREGIRFPGVRIENASYPLTITGTQAALASALSEGQTPAELCAHLPEEPSATYFSHHLQLSAVQEQATAHAQPFSLALTHPADFRTALTGLLPRAVVAQSGFRVAALIGNTRDGFAAGVNVETPLWALGLCAERVALAKAVSNGFRAFEELHVITEKGSFCSPCGACRQVLYEWNPDLRVHLHHPDGSCSSVFSRDLLPFSFGMS